MNLPRVKQHLRRFHRSCEASVGSVTSTPAAPTTHALISDREATTLSSYVVWDLCGTSYAPFPLDAGRSIHFLRKCRRAPHRGPNLIAGLWRVLLTINQPRQISTN